MPFDFKREYREFYLPGNAPELIGVPEMRFVAVRGAGDPNEEGGAYQRALNVLYAVSYTLKMSPRAGRAIEGYFDYVVPPLEGFWQAGFDYADKSAARWTAAIRLPDFVREEDLAWAVAEAGRRKKTDCSAAELLTVEEGFCGQILHVGPYDHEPATLARLEEFLAENGCAPDLTEARLHHEIYLSDPRRTAPEKLRTVLRIPARRL